MCAKFGTVVTGSAGMGLVAMEDISAGDLILREEPLVTVPAAIKAKDVPWTVKVSYLESLVENLPEINRSNYFSLFDCKRVPGKSKTAAGIFRTNNFALGKLTESTDHGVFHIMSRVNHSCCPNCEVVWREHTGEQELRAIEDIRKGESMSICYLGEEEWRKETQSRRGNLEAKYGFICNCKACAGQSLDGVRLRLGLMEEFLDRLEDGDTRETQERLSELYRLQFGWMEEAGAKVCWRLKCLDRMEELGLGRLDTHMEDRRLKLDWILHGEKPGGVTSK